MANLFQKVKPGDPLKIPATTYNAMVDAAAAMSNLRRDVNLGAAKNFPSHYILVKNCSGEDIDSFGILGIDGPVFGPDDSLDSFKYDLILKGVKPDGSHNSKYVVIQEPATKDSIVRACAIGVTVAKIKDGDEDEGESETCQIVVGETKFLKKGNGRATILWSEEGSEEKWAVVMLGGGGSTSTQYAMVMEAISQPSDVTADPPDGLGKIRILGKKYDSVNPEYDDCGCLELADSEKLVKGASVTVIGPFEGEEEEEGEGETENKKKLYYLAVGTRGEYYAKIKEDVELGETATFDVKDSDGTLHEFSASAMTLPQNTKILGNASSFNIKRHRTDEGMILVIVGGPCPIEIEEEE